jgi:SAM-dependent methyltransferase
MSLPVFKTRSVFFMQSRKVTKLIVTNKDGIPVFEFPFEIEDEQCDRQMLKEAFKAMSTIMKQGSISCEQLQSMKFKDVEIMVEIRGNFAALLLVGEPTTFLRQSLESFANDFRLIYPEDPKSLDDIPVEKLNILGGRLVQKDFGLQQEELHQIMKLIQDGYNRVAALYLKERADEAPEYKLLMEFIHRMPKDGLVLDAGCGAGIPVTRTLAKHLDVIGVDISRRQIQMARDLVPKAKFLWQDMNSLSYEDKHFDGIISFYAIPHIPRDEHLPLLRNFYRMLKEGGYALLCFSTEDDPGTVVDDFLGVKMYWSGFDAITNKEMLKQIGYNIVWEKTIFDSITDEYHLFILVKKGELDEVDKAPVNLGIKSEEKEGAIEVSSD